MKFTVDKHWGMIFYKTEETTKSKPAF